MYMIYLSLCSNENLQQSSTPTSYISPISTTEASTSGGVACSSKQDADFDDPLTCVICQEIMHDCVG